MGARSGMLLPVGKAWMDSRIPEIAARLQQRDSRLEILARIRRAGDAVGVYEVWWDGQFVARFGPHEVEQIEPTIYALDRNTPGHVETIDRLEQREAARERTASERFREVYIEMAARLAHEAADDQQEPRTFFGSIPGRRSG